MKKAIVTAIIMLTGASAMAQYYPGPAPGGYYPPPGGGGYHHQQPDPNDQASAMSAATGAMFLSLATMCGAGPGCYYKNLVAATQEEAVLFKVDGSVGPYLARTLEVSKTREGLKDLSLEQQIENIIQFKP
ncbi:MULTISPECIES: hypothetical protein [unclassified Bdellovibrio]|uniref:hypothetical protein n=1 Tax=unclassified Bdellovibrio TaxID=2633795 RepID=UPI00115799AC|nr:MULTISPECIES: hypothetical protein [unclassified Bdellovibrio]QLY25944.1 hypothetical protein HW988_02590 [Bdellovibrio sp. KM01]